MKTRIVTAATEHPVTLLEARAQLQDPPDVDDAYIDTLIATATVWLETAYKRAFVSQTHDCFVDEWPAGALINLPFGRLQSISAFEWTDRSAVARTWTVTGSYLMDGAIRKAYIDSVSEPARIVLTADTSWPADELQPANGIRIRGVFGYGAASTVPGNIKHAIKMLITHLYTNRETVVISDRASVSTQPLPYGLNALMGVNEVFPLC